MKRHLLVLASFCLLAVLVGCGGDSKPTGGSDDVQKVNKDNKGQAPPLPPPPPNPNKPQ